MDVLSQPLITYDQATKEIHAHDRAIAAAISSQSNAGDMSAWTLADLYRKGSGMNPDPLPPAEQEAARAEFLRRYAAWRTQYAALVTPIAAELGHPMPGAETFAVASETPQGGASDLFATQTAAAPAPTVPTVTDEALAAAPPAAPAAANGRSAGKRRTLSQKDTVKLTQVMSAPPPAGQELTPAQRAAWFVQNVRNDMTVEDVLSKAVELELIEGTATGGTSTYELSDGDKRVIQSRLLLLPGENVTDPKARVAVFKFAMTELREIIKELIG